MTTPLQSFTSSRVFTTVLIVLAFILGVIVGNQWIRQPQPHADLAQKNSNGQRMSIGVGQAAVGFVDMKEGKPILSGTSGSDIEVSGWAACADADSPLTKIEVLIDEKPLLATMPTFSRPDVAAAYGRPDFEKSGWKTSVSLRSIDTGDHELSVKVTCSKGKTALLPPFRLDVSRP